MGRAANLALGAGPSLVATLWFLLGPYDAAVGSGFWGLVAVFPLTLLLYVLFRRGRTPTRVVEPWRQIPSAVGAVIATAAYWHRLWTYPGFGMGGIAVGIYNVLAFWWPAVLLFVAVELTAGLIEGAGQREETGAKVIRVLAMGAAAGVCGALLFYYGDAWYYRHHDKVAIEERLEGLAEQMPLRQEGWERPVKRSLTAPTPPMKKELEWRLEGERLEIVFDADGEDGTRDQVISPLMEQFLEGAAGMLWRADTREVEVELRIEGEPVLRMEMEESVRHDNVWNHVEILHPGYEMALPPDWDAIFGRDAAGEEEKVSNTGGGN